MDRTTRKFTYGPIHFEVFTFFSLIRLKKKVFIYYIHTPTFTYTSAQARCDNRSIFKQSLTGLKLEFSFSSIGCHVKDINLPNYLTIA